MGSQSVTVAESRAGVYARLSHFVRRHRNWVGFVFVLPWFISFLWFDALPFILNLYFSFTDFSIGAKPPTWVGLANYREMLAGDRLVWLSLQNTAYYVGFSVPLAILLGFSLALLLNLDLPGRTAFRTIYYLPSIVPVVASSVIWLILLRTQNGLINQILSFVGIAPIRWLTRPEWTKPALIIMSLWGFGSQMVIYLAGLQGIPDELHEAAQIDGAGSLGRLRHITIPLMTPVIFFNLIMGIIGAFQVFTAAFVMTGEGPLKSTLFFMLHLYDNAFSYYRMGYASALALFFFVIILGFTLLVNWTSDRWVYYGND